MPTPTGKRASIRAERYAQDRTYMPSQPPQLRARQRIPQSDGAIITPTGKRTSIRAERYASDPRRMPGEECDLLSGRRFVKPNTDATGDHETSAIGRIRYLMYRAFTEARFGAFGQLPLRPILGNDNGIE